MFRLFVAMALGHIIILAAGFGWLAFGMKLGVEKAWLVGVAPFVAASLIKNALGAALVPAIRRVVRSARVRLPARRHRRRDSCLPDKKPPGFAGRFFFLVVRSLLAAAEAPRPPARLARRGFVGSRLGSGLRPGSARGLRPARLRCG